MNNIISKYKGILPISLFALLSQGVMAQESADTRADSINVAFRKSDVRDVIVPVSKVNVSELMEKNYNTYSLDNMQALTAGYNGQLWNQGEALVLIDGVPRDANNVLPTEIEDITFLKGAPLWQPCLKGCHPHYYKARLHSPPQDIGTSQLHHGCGKVVPHLS